MSKIYVGVALQTEVQPKRREVFRFAGTPTEATHGGRFNYVIGPFNTLRGAQFMATYGENNPHLQTVADAEILAKIS